MAPLLKAGVRQQDDFGLRFKISEHIVDLDLGPTAHHLVSVILNDLLDVVGPEDLAADRGEMLEHLACLVRELSAQVGYLHENEQDKPSQKM